MFFGLFVTVVLMVLRIEEGLSRGSDLRAQVRTKIDWTRPDVFIATISGVVDSRRASVIKLVESIK